MIFGGEHKSIPFGLCRLVKVDAVLAIEVIVQIILVIDGRQEAVSATSFTLFLQL